MNHKENWGRSLRIVLTIGSLVLSSTALQTTVLGELSNAGFALVEIGSYGKIRTLDFGADTFRTRVLENQFVLVGTSISGDDLLVSEQSPYAGRRGCALDIVSPRRNGTIHIEPAVRSMRVWMAELSADGRTIAFVGSTTATRGAKAVFGLHLLRVSGEAK